MNLFSRRGGQPTPEQVFQNEAQAVFSAAYQSGLGDIGDLNKSELFTLAGTLSVHEIFSPDETSGISSNDAYFLSQRGKRVREGIERGDPAMIAIGRKFGRVLAAGRMSGDYAFEEEALQIGNGLIVVGGEQIEYDTESGNVIDLGVGISGLFSHINNLRTAAQTGEYSLISAVTDNSELALLTGIADFHDVDSEDLEITANGMQHMIEGLLAREDFEPADLMVASRVHGAGPELRYAITHVHEVLRPGGIIVAQGPRGNDFGIGYNEVQKLLGSNTRMRVEVKKTFDRTFDEDKDPEANRLIVATRK